MMLVANAGLAKAPNYPKAKVSFDDFKGLVAEVETHRADRLVDLNTFLNMSKEDGAIVLDSRSDFRFERIHLKGAQHLAFTDFTQDNLRKVIPNSETRILIYCNNNFDGNQTDFASKIAMPLPNSDKAVATQLIAQAKPLMMALNIPTYINLYGYGYRNIYELHELVEVNDPRVTFEGSILDQKTSSHEGAVGVLMWPALTVAGPTENRPADTTIALTLGLRDGSQVRGKTKLETLAIAGAFGELSVPLAQIRGIVIESLSAKGETWQQVSLKMNNGDKLTGRPKAAKLDVETPYGTLSVPLADVAQIEFPPIPSVPAATPGAAGVGGGQILHYTFDADEGAKVTDKSGHGNHGAVGGATWTPKGKVGGAYRFSGGKDHILVDCPALRKSSDDSFSLALWFYAERFNPNDENAVFGISAPRGVNDGAFSYRIGIGRPNGQGTDYSIAFVPGTHCRDNSVAPFMTGLKEKTWYHVTGVYDKGDIRLYVDGVEKGRTRYSLGAAGPYSPDELHKGLSRPPPALVGCVGNSFGQLDTRGLNGIIDEVMFFDRAVTAAEVAGLYRAGGEQPAAGPDERKITVPANASADAWEVIQGRRYWFEASGLVGINVGGPNGGPATKADPNGYTISQMDGSVTDPQPADPRFPCPGLATHSLVGKIGGAGGVPLGKAGSFIAPASGKLTLLCNDLIPGDNSGSWDVKIRDNSASPILHLAFDTDEGGKVSDLSGHGNNGAVVGAKYTPNGKKGGGYCLSGTNEHITIPNSDSLEIRDQVTLAVWVNLASLGPGGYGNEHGYIINKGDDLWWNPTFCLGYNKAGEPLFHVGNATDPQRGGGKSAFGETKLVPGQWVHLAGVYDGATVKLYVNGRLEREEKYAGRLRSDRAPVHLGGGKLFGVDWGNHFTVHGMIDEVMIFARALSTEEIHSLWESDSVALKLERVNPHCFFRP